MLGKGAHSFLMWLLLLVASWMCCFAGLVTTAVDLPPEKGECRYVCYCMLPLYSSSDVPVESIPLDRDALRANVQLANYLNCINHLTNHPTH